MSLAQGHAKVKDKFNKLKVLGRRKIMTELNTTYDYAKYYQDTWRFNFIPLWKFERDNNGEKKVGYPKAWQKYQSEVYPLEQFPTTSKGIAIVTGKISGVTVIDFDRESAYQQFVEKYGKPSYIVKSFRGYHCYFQYTTLLETAADKATGIDIRNDSGLIFAPPTPSYEFISTGELQLVPDEFIKNYNEKYQSKSISKPTCVRGDDLQNNTHSSVFRKNLSEIPILEIAEKLGIEVNRHNKAPCFNGHDSKTRSMSFNTDKNYLFCFGCGVGGGPVKLVMGRLKINYIGAITWLIKNN